MNGNNFSSFSGLDQHKVANASLLLLPYVFI